jgi:hypothetical protein
MKDLIRSERLRIRGVAIIGTAIGAVAVGAFAIGALARRPSSPCPRGRCFGVRDVRGFSG